MRNKAGKKKKRTNEISNVSKPFKIKSKKVRENRAKGGERRGEREGKGVFTHEPKTQEVLQNQMRANNKEKHNAYRFCTRTKQTNTSLASTKILKNEDNFAKVRLKY